MHKKFATLVCVALALTSVTASAAITYIDAMPNLGAGGNTTVNGAFVDPENITTGSGSSGAMQVDGKWHYRTPTSGTNNGTPPNNDAYWETDGSSVANSEDAPPLITTINVPAPGIYNLYAMYIMSTTNTTGYGDIMVGVNNPDPSTHKYFNHQNAAAAAPFDLPGVSTLTTATGTEFDAATSSPSPVQTRWAGSVFQMYLANLGQFNLTNTTVSFYITGPNVPPASGTTSQRTIYEGVAYELAPAPAHPGDFDGDGDVDGADFVAWQTNFPKATGATLAEGDADADGDVDGADFVVWQTNFPFTPSPGTAAVPEPAAICSAIVALAVFGVSRLRKARRRAA
jgi:hypothetical protein